MDRIITSSPEVVLVHASATNSSSSSNSSKSSSPNSPPPPSFSPPPAPPTTSPPASPCLDMLPINLLLQPSQLWHQTQARRSLQLSFNSFNLDRIDEDLDAPMSESCKSQYERISHGHHRKRSIDSDLLSLYSYYNKYFDRSYGRHQRRRFSAPSRTTFTSLDDDGALPESMTPTTTVSKSPTRKRRPNRLMFSLDVNNEDYDDVENDPFTTKNIEKHNQCSVNQENFSIHNQCVDVFSVNRKMRRSPRLDLCFTPSQEQAFDCFMSCEKCYKCGHQRHLNV